MELELKSLETVMSKHKESKTRNAQVLRKPSQVTREETKLTGQSQFTEDD